MVVYRKRETGENWRMGVMSEGLGTIEEGKEQGQVKLPVKVLRPSKGWISLKLRDLWEYRELLFFLTWRDIKVRYPIIFAGWKRRLRMWCDVAIRVQHLPGCV